MTAPTTARPLQPSHRRLFAQFLAGLDPRCLHAASDWTPDYRCPACRRDLDTYLAMVPQEWGA
jgi:hypothetical protein